jgi:PAS domain S-box-containing protein
MPRRPTRESRRSIVLRIAVVTGAALTIIVGMLLVARNGLVAAERDSRAADTAEALAHDATASDAAAELQQARAAGYLIDADPVDIAEYWEIEAIEATRFRRLRAGFAGDPAVQRALREELAIGARRRELVNDIFRLAPAGAIQEAHQLAVASETLTELSLLQTAIVLAAAQALSRARLEASNAQLGHVRALLGGLAAGALALGLLLATFLVRWVGRSFKRVQAGEKQFRALVANMPGAAYRRAPAGDWSLSFVSERIREISGHAAADLMDGSTTYASLVSASERERVAEQIAAVPAEGDGAFTVDYPIAHADGSARWVREMGHVVRDGDGAIRWLDGTIADVTQEKRLAGERVSMEAELRLAQRLDAVGQLAAGIAHEINTPIQFVGDSVRFLDESYGDLRRLLISYRALLDESDSPELRLRVEEVEDAADLVYLQERIPPAFERTHEGVRRVSAIVRAMKDFGRPSQVAHEPADLNDALRSTLVVSQNEYKYVADIDTQFAELPRVVCNVSELNQVFLNLIVNAAHAIGGNGRWGTIQVSTAHDETDAIITISDDGPGIPADIRERIFDPFFTTKDVGRGTGQGLAIARSIVVDKHAGTLSVDSRPGEGSTFTVRLPVLAAS